VATPIDSSLVDSWIIHEVTFAALILLQLLCHSCWQIFFFYCFCHMKLHLLTEFCYYCDICWYNIFCSWLLKIYLLTDFLLLLWALLLMQHFWIGYNAWWYIYWCGFTAVTAVTPAHTFINYLWCMKVQSVAGFWYYCDHSCRYNICWLCHSWRYICQLDFSAVTMATSAEAFVNCLWCMQLHLLTLFCYNCNHSCW